MRENERDSSVLYLQHSNNNNDSGRAEVGWAVEVDSGNTTPIRLRHEESPSPPPSSLVGSVSFRVRGSTNVSMESSNGNGGWLEPLSEEEEELRLQKEMLPRQEEAPKAAVAARLATRKGTASSRSAKRRRRGTTCSSFASGNHREQTSRVCQEAKGEAIGIRTAHQARVGANKGAA